MSIKPNKLDDLPVKRRTAALTLLWAMEDTGADVFFLPCRDSQQARALKDLERSGIVRAFKLRGNIPVRESDGVS